MALYLRAPLGPCLEVGFLENIFGDTNFCIKKSVFDQLGGFDPTPGLVYEDWDFLARLSFHGYHQDVIPRELFWYRHRDDSWARRHASPRLPDCIYQAYQAQTSRPVRHILTRVAIPAVYQTWRLQQQLGQAESQLAQAEIQLIEVKDNVNRTAHRLAARLNRWLDSQPRFTANAKRMVKAWSYLRQGRVRLVLEKSLAVLARVLARGVKALTAQVQRLSTTRMVKAPPSSAPGKPTEWRRAQLWPGPHRFAGGPRCGRGLG